MLLPMLRYPGLLYVYQERYRTHETEPISPPKCNKHRKIASVFLPIQSSHTAVYQKYDNQKKWYRFFFFFKEYVSVCIFPHPLTTGWQRKRKTEIAGEKRVTSFWPFTKKLSRLFFSPTHALEFNFKQYVRKTQEQGCKKSFFLKNVWRRERKRRG